MRRRAKSTRNVRAALVEHYRDLVVGTGTAFDQAYAYAPTVGWGATLDALRDGHPVRISGDVLRCVGAQVDADDAESTFELDADDRITLVLDAPEVPHP